MKVATTLASILTHSCVENVKQIFDKLRQSTHDELNSWRHLESQNFVLETQQNLEIWERLTAVKKLGLELETVSASFKMDEYRTVQKEIYFNRFLNSWHEFREVIKINRKNGKHRNL